MRKFALSLLALFLCVGLTLAAQVKFLSYSEDKKELVVKDGDKEKTLKLTDKTKYINNANGKEIAADKVGARMKRLKKDEEVDVTLDGDKVTEIKLGKKKDK